MDKQRLRIKPSFPSPEDHKQTFDLYVSSIEKLICKVIPAHLLEEDESTFYTKLNKMMPIPYFTLGKEAPSTISIAILCQAQYTQGTARYMSDMGSRWLIPGKQLNLVITRCLSFEFAQNPGIQYFINELIIHVENNKDLSHVRYNLPNMIRDIQRNILAVQHTRQVVLQKHLTLEQKKIVIQENIASLINQPLKEFNNSMFDQMQNLLIKASAEDKVTKIQEQFTPFLELRPNAFDGDIFKEIQHFVLQMRDHFTAIRKVKHLNRIISYQYLFRKTLGHAVANNPTKRHLSLKLMRTTLHHDDHNQTVLGILIAINFIKENEIFEDQHIMKAVQHFLPHVKMVKQSSMIDRRGSEKIRTLYLEVYKDNQEAFTIQEFKDLRKKLPRELKSRVETVVNPIFILRNEEEVMRNIVVLSNQLKYIQDIPQMIVNFHEQSLNELTFTVILLRLEKEGQAPLDKLLKAAPPHVRFFDHELKIVGILRKRYSKEAHVFQLSLDKKPFIRKDYSLNLYKARQSVITHLSAVLGELRDYNGGMISQKNEIFTQLKSLLQKINIRNDFLLENFFYSLTPAYMQSMLDPNLLQKQFLLLLEALERDFSQELYTFKTQILDDHLLLMLGTTTHTLVDYLKQIISHSDIKYREITHTNLNVYDIHCLGYLIRFEDAENYSNFKNTIISSLKTWDRTLPKPFMQEDTSKQIVTSAIMS